MTIDFSFSGGFIGGKKLMQAFEEHLGDATFADAKIPLYIIATNLDTGKERIFSEGSIIHAIRASISVPGVMRPYLYEGNYYVDGAVTNPLPVDVLHNNKHKNIVAVHLHEYIEERDSTSAPGVLETMSRSMGIVSRYLAKAKMQEAVAVIEPKVAGIDMFHFYQAQIVIDRGAQAAKTAVEQGALDSIGSQSAYSLQTLGEDMRLNELYNTYMSKANKALDSANTISQYANLLMSGLNTYSNVMDAGKKTLEEQQEQALKEIESKWNKAYSAAITYNSQNISAAESYYKGLRSGSSSSSKSAWSMTKGDTNRRVDITSALNGLYNLKKQNNLLSFLGKVY